MNWSGHRISLWIQAPDPPTGQGYSVGPLGRARGLAPSRMMLDRRSTPDGRFQPAHQLGPAGRLTYGEAVAAEVMAHSSVTRQPNCAAAGSLIDSHLTAFAVEGRGPVPTVLAFHEVDDVNHWLSSPKRKEVFGPLGITVRTFRDPEGSKRVGLIVEVPDMATFQKVMQSEETADAMKFDGVHPETLLVLTEA